MEVYCETHSGGATSLIKRDKMEHAESDAAKKESWRESYAYHKDKTAHAAVIENNDDNDDLVDDSDEYVQSNVRPSGGVTAVKAVTTVGNGTGSGNETKQSKMKKSLSEGRRNGENEYDIVSDTNERTVDRYDKNTNIVGESQNNAGHICLQVSH